jgi:hypothetical protein
MSHVPLNVLMLGADFVSPTAGLGGVSVQFDSMEMSQMGNRDLSEMATRVAWYIDNGYAGDKAQAIAWAIRDYDVAHAAKTQILPSAGGKTTASAASTFWQDVGKLAITQMTNPQLIAAIKGKNPGISDTDAQKIADAIKANQSAGGFSMQEATPWLILGGVALLALIVMMGTRRRA